MRTLFFLIFFIPSITIAGNVNIDSLLSVVINQKDTDKAATYFLISKYFLTDSIEKSKMYSDSLLELEKKINKPIWKAKAFYNLGCASLQLYNSDEAIANIEKALSVFKRVHDTEWLVKTYIVYGTIYYNIMEYEEAIKRYMHANELLPELEGNTDLIILTWNNIAASYISLKDYQQGIVYLDKSHKLAKETGNESEIIYIFNNYAFICNNKGEYDSALYYYNESLQLSQRSGDLMESAFTIALKGNTYYYKGEYEKCLNQYLEAVQLFEKTGNKTSLSRYLNNIAVVYKKTGKHEEAIEYFLLSIKIKEGLNDFSGIAITFNNIGTIYSERKNRKKALEYFRNALEINKKKYSTSIAAMVYNNIGGEFYFEEEYDSALYYYTESLNLKDSVWEKHSIIESLNNIGNLYYDIFQDYNKAKPYIERAMQLSREIGSGTLLAQTQTVLSNILIKEGKYNEAMILLKKSQQFAENENFTEILPDIYQGLIKISLKKNNYRSAFGYQQELDALEDSIFSVNQTQIVNELQTKYETEKKEKENQILRQNIQIQQRTTLLLIISLIALIIVIILFYFFYRLKNKALKQKAILYEQERKLQELEKSRLEDQLFAGQQINKLQNEKLEHQNRELSSRILHAINKNEIMSSILEELKKNKDDESIDNNQCYIRVNQLVKENTSVDKEWNHFKIHFEEVNPGFFQSLQTEFPKLTQNELKLCAYYRINLNTKEIAQILNVTPSAVQKSRYRLRKKMGIPSETELPEFMGRF